METKRTKSVNFIPELDIYGLFLVGPEWKEDGSLGKVVAARAETPSFNIVAGTTEEAVRAGCAKINAFLAKMHSYGHR